MMMIRRFEVEETNITISSIQKMSALKLNKRQKADVMKLIAAKFELEFPDESNFNGNLLSSLYVVLFQSYT